MKVTTSEVGIPKKIKEARLINVLSNKEFALTTKPGKCCHFVERFFHEGYEIVLRIDWSDMNQSGDPMLDADFYTPGETKPLDDKQFKRVHHTSKKLNADAGLWIYDFKFAFADLSLKLADISLQLLLKLKITQEQTGIARIVLPDQKKI
jgi:hypothetical protein